MRLEMRVLRVLPRYSAMVSTVLAAVMVALAVGTGDVDAAPGGGPYHERSLSFPVSSHVALQLAQAPTSDDMQRRVPLKNVGKAEPSQPAEGVQTTQDAAVGSVHHKVAWPVTKLCSQTAPPRPESGRKIYDAGLTEYYAFLSCIWHDPSMRGKCIDLYGCTVVLSHDVKTCLGVASDVMAKREEQRMTGGEQGNSLAKLCKLRSAARGLCLHIPELLLKKPETFDDADPCKP